MILKLAGKIKNAISNCEMHFKQRDFDIFLFNDVSQLPKTDWEAVVNDDIFWSIAYHQALQSGCSENVSFRYVIVYENGKPLASCYFQIIDLKNQSINSILNPEYFSKIYSKLNGRTADYSFGSNGKAAEYVCICGNLFVSGDYGISCRDAELLPIMKKTFPEIMNMIAKGLDKNTSVFATVIKDFCNNKNELFNAFEKSAFIPFEIDPDMIVRIDRNWKKPDDYLQAFSSKYRVRANNVLAKSNSILKKEFNARDILQYSNEIKDLFNTVYVNAPVKIASNNAAYFYHLKVNLKDKFKFTAFFDGDRLVAFSTAIINSTFMHAHHIGLDYSANKNFALYQNILYQYIFDAIKNGSVYINLGRDALEIKSTVGAVPEQLKLFIRFSNSFTHLVLESFSKITQPGEWIQRKPFKEVVQQRI